MTGLVVPAQTHLNYRHRVDPPIGAPMGPTTYGGIVYVVSVEHPTPGTTRVGMSAINPVAAK